MNKLIAIFSHGSVTVDGTPIFCLARLADLKRSDSFISASMFDDSGCITAIESKPETIENRQLQRYPYTDESSRSRAMTNARTFAEARRRAGENVQWRHIDDTQGSAYVVERLG